MANFLTLLEIRTEVNRAIKMYKGSKNDFVDSLINMVYLNEIMCCDDLYPLYWLRQLSDGKRSVAPGTVTGITQAASGIVTATAHGLSAGDLFSLHDNAGMVEVNDRLYRAGTTGHAANALALADLDGTAIDTSGYTAWTSGGVVHHRGFTLSENVESMDTAAWHSYQPMLRATESELEGTTKWWGGSSTRPTRWVHRKSFDGAGVEANQIVWFPGASEALPLRYWYQDRPARLAAVGDVPKLPHRFHDTIVSGVIVRLMESNVQVENAVVWPGLYRQQIDAIKTFNRKWWEAHTLKRNEAPYLL